jgi:hypothetical protein
LRSGLISVKYMAQSFPTLVFSSLKTPVKYVLSVKPLLLRNIC